MTSKMVHFLPNNFMIVVFQIDLDDLKSLYNKNCVNPKSSKCVLDQWKINDFVVTELFMLIDQLSKRLEFNRSLVYQSFKTCTSTSKWAKSLFSINYICTHAGRYNVFVLCLISFTGSVCLMWKLYLNIIHKVAIIDMLYPSNCFSFLFSQSITSTITFNHYRLL